MEREKQAVEKGEKASKDKEVEEGGQGRKAERSKTTTPYKDHRELCRVCEEALARNRLLTGVK